MKNTRWAMFCCLSFFIFNSNRAYSISPLDELIDISLASKNEGENVVVGATEGKFDVTEIGAATYSIPIKVPKGVSGLQPNLAITYNSQVGNGMLGYGFSLSGISSITRGSKTIFHDGKAVGYDYTNNDAFYLDGKRLILIEYTEDSDSAIYCLEDDKNARIVFHGINNNSLNKWFTVNLNNGIIYEYGKNGGQQCYSPKFENNWYIKSWYITKAEDSSGNYMEYEYLSDNICLYPQYIFYGNNISNETNADLRIYFEYEERKDLIPLRFKGYDGQMRYRLKSIASYANIYELCYDSIGDSSLYKYSRLLSVTECKPSGERMNPTVFSWNFINDCSVTSKTYTLNENFYPVADQNKCFFSAGDLNGDGLADIVGVKRFVNNFQHSNRLEINYTNKNDEGELDFSDFTYYNLPAETYYEDWADYRTSPVVADFQGDGINELVIPHRVNMLESDYVEFQILDNNGIHDGLTFNLEGQDFIYDVSDLNNDGRSEILVIQKGNSDKNSAAILGKDASGANYLKVINLSFSSNPISMHLADMNGDGLVDIVIFYQDRYSVYMNNGNWLDSNSNMSITSTSSSNIPFNANLSYTSDFNGDGKTDFVLTTNDNLSIYLADFKGDNLFVFSDITPDDTFGLGSEMTDSANYHIFDIDGDKLTDVVINKYTYNNDKTSTYWYRSNGENLVYLKKATSLKHDDVLNQLYVIGDFNGDGLYELANWGYDCYNSVNASISSAPQWHIYINNHDNIKTGKLASISNGLGAITNISYKPLTDKNIYNQHKEDVSYPIIDVCLPLAVVSEVINLGGAISNDTVLYSYEGIRINLQGRGVVGMTVNKQINKTLGVSKKIYKAEWNEFSLLPEYIEENVKIGTLTSKNEMHFNVPLIDKVYSRHLLWSKNIDFDGKISISNYEYDDNHRLLEEMHFSNDDGHTTVNYYEDYIYSGYRYVPLTIKVGRYYEGYNELFLQTTTYDYNNRGLKTSVIENYGSSKPLCTTYTYDIFGNVKSKSQSGAGVNVSTEYYDYDITNRFITKKYTTAYPRIKISYEYDMWDNLISVTDSTRASYPQTTTYTYDGWGRKLSEISPTGQSKTFTQGWGSSMAQRYYILEQGTAIPWKKTWYDVQGREVKQESVGANDVLLAKTISYNNNGQVSQIANTVGDITTTDYFTYDTRGRVLSEYTNTGKSKTYSYSGNTVTSTIDGKSYSATYDSWGNVIETSGPEGTVSYMYHSCGKPISITSNGSTVTMEYDDCGNQTKLTDPDAGIMTYAYDALGRVTTERDASGNTTTYSYNKFGKVSSVKVNNDYQTSYSYSILGNNTGLLTSITCNSDRTYKIDYTYDAYNRVTKEVHNIPNSSLLGTSITYNYTYNTDGLLETMTYPGNVTVRYSYDSYGNKIGTSLNGQNVWALEATDGYETTVNRGQNLTSTERLDMNGNLVYSDIAYNGSILHQMAYTHNANTGNVLSRTGMFTSKENFTYDDVDRLTGVSGGMSAEYRYAPNGNITFMTGMGNFAYESSKPHAVTGVENTTGQIDKSTLYTTYNSIGKISTIHDPESGFRMNFSYGPDNARCDVSLYNGFDTIQHITYIPGCDIVSEKDQDGEYFHQWYYYIGDGVLYYRDSYGNTDTYYTYTDNIGSITRIYDGNGDLQFSAKYDPWGKQTNVTNNIGLIRGYTGHEHIWPFGLINMNGRLYDPFVGRFLSTDNFVQEPLNAQNFNRYSYCLNNPLKYNDPSGESWLLVAAAVAGGIFNLINNWDKIDDFGSFIGYLGVGVAAGAGGAYIGAAAAAGVGASGILGGIISGGAGGFTTGVVEGSGNTLLQGGDFVDIFENGLYSGLNYGVAGAVTGGVVGGITSYAKGENIWNGSPKTVDINLSEIEPIKVSTINQVTPQMKGELGVNRAINEFVENGGVVYSKEVTIKLEGVKNRFDFVGKQDNLLYLYEVKNGPSARMTINQRINIPKMQQYKPSFWPKGKNALKIPEFRFSIINNQPYGGDYIVIYKHYID